MNSNENRIRIGNSGQNTVRNAGVSWARNETSCCSRSSGNMTSVRSGHSADWEAGVWSGCHTSCSKLASVEGVWDMVTDSTVDSGGNSPCRIRYRATPATGCLLSLLTGSASTGAARSVTTTLLARTATTIGTRTR